MKAGAEDPFLVLERGTRSFPGPEDLLLSVPGRMKQVPRTRFSCSSEEPDPSQVPRTLLLSVPARMKQVPRSRGTRSLGMTSALSSLPKRGDRKKKETGDMSLSPRQRSGLV